MEDTEVQASADDFAIQEEPSAEPEVLSEVSEEASQEPDVATLATQLEEARREAEEARKEAAEAQALARAHQAAKDREVREAVLRAKAQERQEKLDWARRAKEDPEEAERYAAAEEARLAAEAWQESQRDAVQSRYVAVYHDIRLGLSEEERKDAEARAIERPGGLTTDGFLAEAQAIRDRKKEASSVKAEIDALKEENKAMREEVAALKGVMAGNNLRNSGGPEKPLSGSGASKPIAEKIMDPTAHFTLEELEAMQSQLG